MTDRELMQQALEAMRFALHVGFDESSESQIKKGDKAVRQHEAAITAIREALAQPEQEPVAWSYWQSCLNDDGTQTAPWVHRLSKFKPDESIINKDIVPLYTTPQPAQQQKPVVWMYVNRSTHETSFQKQMRSFVDHGQWKEIPLYSEPLANHELQCVCGAVWLGDEMVHLPDKRLPPQRKPLSDEQLKEIWLNGKDHGDDWLDVQGIARAIEAAHGIKE